MEKMVFKCALLSGDLAITMQLISLLSAELILWPICALSRFRLSPKSLETSQHGGQGLLSPFYPTFSSFVNSFP